MPTFRALSIAALVLALAALPAAAGDSEDDLLHELEAFGDRLEEAMLADDVDTMLAMYTEDAISLPNFGPRLDGIAAFRQHHAEMKESGMEIHSFESRPTDAWGCDGQVIEIGTFEISLSVPGMPEPIHDAGKYMTVYVRDPDGELKIKAETWNTDTDPMAAAAPGHEHGDAPAEGSSSGG